VRIDPVIGSGSTPAWICLVLNFIAFDSFPEYADQTENPSKSRKSTPG
jgi:hypothetical protein